MNAIPLCKKKFLTLKELRCWKATSRPNDKRVIHTKLVLNQNHDVTGEIKSYKAPLVVCGNARYETEVDTPSPEPDFTVIKLIMRIAEQKSYHCRHFGFQNAFPNSKFNCLVHTELLKVIFGDDVRVGKLTRLTHSLYGMEDDARIWYQ